MNEIGQADGLPEQLENFRLPALKCVAAHLGQKFAELRALPVFNCLINIGGASGGTLDGLLRSATRPVDV